MPPSVPERLLPSVTYSRMAQTRTSIRRVSVHLLDRSAGVTNIDLNGPDEVMCEGMPPDKNRDSARSSGRAA